MDRLMAAIGITVGVVVSGCISYSPAPARYDHEAVLESEYEDCLKLLGENCSDEKDRLLQHQQWLLLDDS